MSLINKLKGYKQIMAVLGIYLFLSFAGCVMVLVRMLFTGKTTHAFLIWNLFLTWVPLVFSVIINYINVSYRRGAVKSILMFITGGIWLIFYPNAPYIITDFIHLNSRRFFMAHGGYQVDFIVWYDFVMISLFILTGFLLGFISLYLVQRLLVQKLNRWIGWLFVSAMLFLSSYGIYLGRFIRWNSWDIITNPIALTQSILESFHRYAFAFTATFGLFLILIYVALYYLTHLNDYHFVFRSKPKF